MKKGSFRCLTRLVLGLAVAVFGVGLTTARADSFTTFSVVNGVFDSTASAASLTGTITIDTTTDMISAASLTVSAFTGFTATTFTFANLTSQSIDNGSTSNAYFADFVSGTSILQFVFETTSTDGSLTGYNGGSLCNGGTSTPCGDPTELTFTSSASDPTSFSTSGSLAAVNATAPEPGTFLLLCSGLAGLALLRRKRLAANS